MLTRREILRWLARSTVDVKPGVKALYLSFFGIGSRELRDNALRLIDESELNALVIDAKGDRGLVSYRSSVPLAAEVGAQRVRTIPNLPALLNELRRREIYTIARIVAFKDHPLALSRPEWAVRTASGGIWLDRENLGWADPFRPQVRDYNLSLAEEAAVLGFDEVQFDYVRFPDAQGLRFAEPSTMPARVATITSFLAEARSRLRGTCAKLSADVFGYILWNKDDTGIGQRLEDLAPEVDFVCPMLYPSGFHFGIPGYRNAVEHPFEVVLHSLREARQRTGLPPARFRPWLQAFRDYQFDGREYGAFEIHRQIEAAEEFGSTGWMLWNPTNRYPRFPDDVDPPKPPTVPRPLRGNRASE